MKTILLLNHKKRLCGVQQWGTRVKEILKTSQKYNFIYKEVETEEEFRKAVSPQLLSAVIYNYHVDTLPWLTADVMRTCFEFKNIAVVHEGFSHLHDPIGFEGYIYVPEVVTTDRRRKVFTIGRPLLNYLGKYSINPVPTIGSFGFGFSHKRFDHLVQTVHNEFDEAVINLSIPYDKGWTLLGIEAKNTVKKCKEIITKPGIQLNITHKFLEEGELLTFLAGNDLNAFFYDSSKLDSSSGATDFALSVKRPIALVKSPMFKHILSRMNESICIEDLSLKEIIAKGIKPLESLYTLWSHENLVSEFETICDICLEN